MCPGRAADALASHSVKEPISERRERLARRRFLFPGRNRHDDITTVPRLRANVVFPSHPYEDAAPDPVSGCAARHARRGTEFVKPVDLRASTSGREFIAGWWVKDRRSHN